MFSLSHLFRHEWRLAFVEPVNKDALFEQWNYKWINYSTKRRWYADPFILDVSEKNISLLVEEKTYSIGRGRIAKLIIDRKTRTLIEEKIILDLPYHLSFPIILRYGGKVYIYPENSRSGKLNIYKYNLNDDSVTFVDTLSEEPLTDAVIVTFFDKPLIFTTKHPESNGHILSIYSSNEIIGVYEKVNELAFSERIARNAGDFFSYKGKIIRPTQIYDNNNGYGAGLTFQEVNYCNGKFSMNEVARVLPPKGFNGIHTFNTYKDIIVVDGKKPAHPFIFNTLRWIKRKIESK